MATPALTGTPRNGHAYPIDACGRTDAAPGQELRGGDHASRQTGTNGHPSEAKIYTSADGQDWHEVATVKPNNPGAAL